MHLHFIKPKALPFIFIALLCTAKAFPQQTKDVAVFPQYPGGTKALYHYLCLQSNYLKKFQWYQNTFRLEFIIDSTGHADTGNFKSDVLRFMPRWRPLNYKGRNKSALGILSVNMDSISPAPGDTSAYKALHVEWCPLAFERIVSIDTVSADLPKDPPFKDFVFTNVCCYPVKIVSIMTSDPCLCNYHPYGGHSDDPILPGQTSRLQTVCPTGPKRKGGTVGSTFSVTITSCHCPDVEYSNVPISLRARRYYK